MIPEIDKIAPPTKNLTTEQRRLVRGSFDALREMAVPIALLFYGRLFELDPSAQRLFHIDLELQSRKLMDMLSSIVESLDNFDSMRGKLAELGRKHTTYGVRPEQYETLAAALVWTLGQALGADFDDRTREAWYIALAAISEAMKTGG
jgi:hemoglobin-like flavoprotein